MAELPRQSRRLRGKPPEYSPSQLEGLRALVTPSDSRVGSSEEGESCLVVHPDYQVQATEYISEPISFSEVTGSISSTSELAEEPEISEDGLKYTFKLREGLKWSNGEPITAKDFEFCS